MALRRLAGNLLHRPLGPLSVSPPPAATRSFSFKAYRMPNTVNVDGKSLPMIAVVYPGEMVKEFEMRDDENNALEMKLKIPDLQGKGNQVMVSHLGSKLMMKISKGEGTEAKKSMIVFNEELFKVDEVKAKRIENSDVLTLTVPKLKDYK